MQLLLGLGAAPCFHSSLDMKMSFTFMSVVTLAVQR